MSKLPRVRKVTYTNLYDEVIEAKIVPKSISAETDIDAGVEEFKLKLREGRQDAIRSAKDTMNLSNQTEEEIQEAYVDAKITMDIAMHGGDMSEERMKSQRAKRTKKLIEGKTKDDLLQELPLLYTDIRERTDTVVYTITRTIWNTLRKIDDVRKKQYETMEELQAEVDKDVIFDLFNTNIEDVKVNEEDAKNLQSPAS